MCLPPSFCSYHFPNFPTLYGKCSHFSRYEYLPHKIDYDKSLDSLPSPPKKKEYICNVYMGCWRDLYDSIAPKPGLFSSEVKKCPRARPAARGHFLT